MSTKAILLEQFDIAWSLATYHLNGLTTEECLWAPAKRSIRLHQSEAGIWVADWPSEETYNIGPASIGWTTWHMLFWWTNAVRSFNQEPPLGQQDIIWPGSAERARQEIEKLHRQWRELLLAKDDQELSLIQRNSWPIPESSGYRIVAWLNLELMKNAAELGAMRFAYAVRN